MVIPDVNRIGRTKAVTSIPIMLGHYRQLLGDNYHIRSPTYNSPRANIKYFVDTEKVFCIALSLLLSIMIVCLSEL